MSTLKTDKKGLALPRRTKPTVILPFTPSMPDVNLLPPRVFDAVAAKKAQHKIIVVGGVMALVVVALFLGQTAQIMVADRALEAEQTKGVDLDKQVKALSPVKAFYDGVDAQKVNVKRTMARELYFSEVASDLMNSSSPRLNIRTMTVTAAADAGATASSGTSCPAPNPFQPVPIVTCVQFTGTATTREAVSDFLLNLNKNTKFANTYIPVTDSGDGKSVTFNGSVGITDKFFSNRYAKDSYLIDGRGETK